MNPTRPKGRPRMRNWIVTLGFFMIVQLIFYAVDGTSWEPNLNDSRNLAGRMFSWLLNTKLLTEWIAPYSFPFFNLFTIVFIFVLLVKAVMDIFASIRANSR